MKLVVSYQRRNSPLNAGEVGMGKAPFFGWGAIASYIAYTAINE